MDIRIWLDVPKDMCKKRRKRCGTCTEKEYEEQIWPNRRRWKASRSRSARRPEARAATLSGLPPVGVDRFRRSLGDAASPSREREREANISESLPPVVSPLSSHDMPAKPSLARWRVAAMLSIIALSPCHFGYFSRFPDFHDLVIFRILPNPGNAILKFCT